MGPVVSDRQKLKIDDGQWLLVESYGPCYLGRLLIPLVPTPEGDTQRMSLASLLASGVELPNAFLLFPCYKLTALVQPAAEGGLDADCKATMGLHAMPFLTLSRGAPRLVRWSAFELVHEYTDADLDLMRRCVRSAEGTMSELRAMRTPAA